MVNRTPLTFNNIFRPARHLVIFFLALYAVRVFSQQNKTDTAAIRLDSVSGLELINARGEAVTYKGRRALRLITIPDHQAAEDDMLAIVPGLDFRNGSIEVDVAGSPAPNTPTDSRGFIGIAFRTQDRGTRFESFYLRPTNGRADDQLRRNHSLQYVAIPDFPWFRLRKENPGVYESYTDLEAGEWTKMRIVASGSKAFLYVNGRSQPCLIVNDLKLGESHGEIALWAHWTTNAYFSNLTVRSEP